MPQDGLVFDSSTGDRAGRLLPAGGAGAGVHPRGRSVFDLSRLLALSPAPLLGLPDASRRGRSGQRLAGALHPAAWKPARSREPARAAPVADRSPGSASTGRWTAASSSAPWPSQPDRVIAQVGGGIVADSYPGRDHDGMMVIEPARITTPTPNEELATGGHFGAAIRPRRRPVRPSAPRPTGIAS